MDWSSFANLIDWNALVPIIVAAAIGVGKKLLDGGLRIGKWEVPSLPKWTLPTIVAPLLGAIAQGITGFLSGHHVGPWWGLGLGGASVWVREMLDQVKKAYPPPLPPVTPNAK